MSITVTRAFQIEDEGRPYAFTPGEYEVVDGAKPEDFAERKITPAVANHWMVKHWAEPVAEEAATVGMPEDATTDGHVPVRPVVAETEMVPVPRKSRATPASE